MGQWDENLNISGAVVGLTKRQKSTGPARGTISLANQNEQATALVNCWRGVIWKG